MARGQYDSSGGGFYLYARRAVEGAEVSLNCELSANVVEAPTKVIGGGAALQFSKEVGSSAVSVGCHTPTCT